MAIEVAARRNEPPTILILWTFLALTDSGDLFGMSLPLGLSGREPFSVLLPRALDSVLSRLIFTLCQWFAFRRFFHAPPDRISAIDRFPTPNSLAKALPKLVGQDTRLDFSNRAGL